MADGLGGHGTFWQGLPAAERSGLRAIGRVTTIQPRALVCHRGDFTTDVIVVLEGYAKELYDSADGQEAIVELFGPGDVLGAFSPWGHAQRATVVAITTLSVLRIEGRQFARMVASNSRVAGALLRTLANRWTYGGRRLAVRATQNRQRMAVHVLELVVRFGRRTPRGTATEIPLNQSELAQWAGIAREGCVRVFGRWRERGVIAYRPRKLTVLDLELLRKEAHPWGDLWDGPPAAEEPFREGEPSHPRLAARPAAELRPLNDPGAGRLPPGDPCFTGRRDDLMALDLVLSGPRRPGVVILQGMAGVGKTALAVHWAHQVAEGFSDGVIFVDLRGSQRVPVTAAEALGQILRALGVPGDQVPAEEGELVALYRFLSADRRVLLMLDNVADPDQIRPLLPGPSTGLLVVTTQKRLTGLTREDRVRVIELDELPPEEAVELLAAVLGTGDRRVGAEPEAAARLARQCAHLPLALGLVAARLAENRGETLADTVRELSGPGRLAVFRLDHDPRGALATAFTLSYRGLETPLREAFRTLGLTTGPDFSVEAAAALLGLAAGETRDRLDALAQAFLIGEGAPGRYRMHELLRDFARERGLLEDTDGRREAAQRRLLTFYLTCMRGAGQSWLEAERRNLVAAVRQAARLGLHRTTWELADALYGFLEFRRYSGDNVRVHKAGLESARAAGDWAAAARMLAHLAMATRELGHNVKAIGYGESALHGFRNLGDRHGEALTLETLADIYGALGRYSTAREHAADALAIHRELGNLAGEGSALNTIAANHGRLGDYDDALTCARRALRIREGTGDRRGRAATLQLLAWLYRRRGSGLDAITHALEALDIFQELEDWHGQASTLAELARVHQHRGMRDMAQRDASRALQIYRTVGARRGEGQALVILGQLRRDEARYPEALTHYGEALAIQQEVGHRRGEAETRAEMGVVHWWLGRYPEAREHLRSALEVHREIGDRHGEAFALEHLARVMRRMDRLEEAFLFGLEALDLWQELGARQGEAGSLSSMARTYLRLGLLGEARRAVEQALLILQEIGDWYGVGGIRDTFALILRRLGRPDEAVVMALEAVRHCRDAGDRHGEATALANLAGGHLDLGRLPESYATAQQALTLAAELNDIRNQAHARHVLGLVSDRLGQHEEAVGHFTEEIRLRQAMGDHRAQMAALRALRDTFRSVGRAGDAADCERRIVGIERWLG